MAKQVNEMTDRELDEHIARLQLRLSRAKRERKRRRAEARGEAFAYDLTELREAFRNRRIGG